MRLTAKKEKTCREGESAHHHWWKSRFRNRLEVVGDELLSVIDVVEDVGGGGKETAN